jgi:hypothetical protein
MRWIRCKTGARSAGAILMLGLIATGCREQEHRGTKNSYAQPLDAVQDPGSHIEPTNNLSLMVLNWNPIERRAWFGSIVRAAAHRCDHVLSAVLKAGDSGSDLWRVGCDDGAWLVTLSQPEPSIESCSGNQSAYCVDRLSVVQWRSKS